MSTPFKNDIKLSFKLRGVDVPIEFAKAVQEHCNFGGIRPSLYSDRQVSHCGRIVRETQEITLEFENFAKVFDFISDIEVMAHLIVIDNNYI